MFKPEPLDATITLTAETTPELAAQQQAEAAQTSAVKIRHEKSLQALQVGVSSREPWNIRNFPANTLRIQVRVYNPTFSIA